MKAKHLRRLAAVAAAVLAAACADSRAVAPLAGPDGAASHLVGGPGTVTLCKVTGDPAQTFNFDVDVNFADATTSASLTVGQCSQIYLGQTAFIDVTENNGAPDSIIAFVPGSASSADTVYAYATNTTEIIARPTLAWTINVYNPVPVVSPPTVSCASISAYQNVAITPVTLSGSGGTGGPYTFSATGLPTGVTLSAGGTVSGTPTVSGTFSYTVTITDKGGHSGSAHCSVTVAATKTFGIGPSSMEGHLTIMPNTWFNGGYSFKFDNNSHVPTQFTVSATVQITVTCPQGGGAGGTITIPLGTRTYSVPANNTDWLPTGDQNSILSWMGAVITPDLCAGHPMDNAKGAVFTAMVNQNPVTGSLVDFRFKYRNPAAKGKTDTNCMDPFAPKRNDAATCGASWSETVRDP